MKNTLTAMVMGCVLSFLAFPVYAQNTTDSNQSGACSAAVEYLKLINDGKYDSVGGLFSKNAVYMGPDGKTRHGLKEIGSFYACFLSIAKPQLRSTKFFAYGNECIMELERKRQSSEFTPEAIDHFTVDTVGKISKFIVYLRPELHHTLSRTKALSKCNERKI